MNKLMTKFGISLLLVAMIGIVSSSDMQAAKKHILIEQHTGAWCGWCPDGSVVMDKLIEKYPDQVIGIKWHNGDAMVLPEQATFSSTFGITGFPTGTVDRTKFGSAVALDRGSWAGAVQAKLDEAPLVDVATTYVYNETNDSIYVTVDITILEDINKQIAMSAFIAEDNCSGTGSQWDQKNYFYHNASFVGHPYYERPATMTGYQHMKVLRKVLGGLLGDKTLFPATVKKDDVYSKTYVIKKSADWKAEDLYAIGVVQYNTSTDRTIINAGESERFELRVVLNVENPSVLVNKGENFTKEISIRNYRDFPVDAEVSILSMPNGWDVTLANSIISLPANGSAQASILIKAPAGGNAEFGKITFGVEPVAKTDWNTFATSGEVYSLTSNTKNVVYGLNPNISYFTNILKQRPGFETNTVQLPFNEDIINAYPAELFTFVTFASGYSSRGTFGSDYSDSQALRDFIRAAIANGTRLLFTSELELYFTFAAENPVADATDLFGTTMGLGGNAQYIQMIVTNSQGQITGYNTLNVRGLEEDISDGLMFNINASAASEPTQRLYYAERLLFSNPEIATPFLEYLDPANGTVMGYAGAKIELPTTRAIFLSFGFEATSSAAKPQLAEDMVDWLFANTSVEETTTDNSGLKMSINPNPVVSAANFEYTVDGSAKQVSIYVVDVTGKIVTELVNGTVNPGTYNVNFDAAKYFNGTYHILANVDGSSAQLPVVIAK